VHLNKFGDGGEHLHAFLLGRPAGVLAARPNLALWEEMFPVVPADAAAAVVAVAVRALADLGEPVEVRVPPVDGRPGGGADGAGPGPGGAHAGRGRRPRRVRFLLEELVAKAQVAPWR
jgi:hypothetical protein